MRTHAGAETWAQRVAEWKASGLTSRKYCEGKPYTAGGLRHWAYRLGAGQSPEASPVRIAKVVRIPRAKAPAAADERARVAPELILEVGPARIEVRTGFDRATLGAVLDVLAAERAVR